MTTDKGRSELRVETCSRSRDAVHTTCYFGVMHALFAGDRTTTRSTAGSSPDSSRGPRTLFRHERQMWGLPAEGHQGCLHYGSRRSKHHMKINGIVPNVLVPPTQGWYLRQHGTQPRETEYHLRGPGAHEALDSGPYGYLHIPWQQSL